MKLTKNSFQLMIGATLLTLLLVAVFQNSNEVTLSFIAFQFQLPLFLVVSISAVFGLVIGRLLVGKR